jgi:N-acetylmuramoyl-L-alanine amidase
MTRLIALLTAACLFVPCAAFSNDMPRRTAIVQTIVIDPGHGGDDDPGAVGPGGVMEKTVTLAIGRKLEALIYADADLRADGVNVVLTRTGDTKVRLEERAAIANNARGNLFISIHVNGHQVRSAYGTETFFLSLNASDAHARSVADAENQTFSEAGGGQQENDNLKLILFDFIHKQYIAESKFVSEQFQTEFNESLNNGDRGVKQAPFRVLKGVAMPAVLVEVDFISNPAREQMLASDEFQDRVAASMLRAIKRYKTLKERGYSAAAQPQAETDTTASTHETR